GKGVRTAGGFDLAGTLRGRGRFDLARYGAKHPRDAVASIADFQPKELEFTMFAGEAVYLATDTAGRSRIVPMSGDPKTEFDRDQIMKMVREAGGTNLEELKLVDEYDAYYLDRHGERPLPVILARLNDEGHTRYYIDPRKGRIAGSYTSRNWVN